MAQRRMFSPDIVSSDAFLDMPISTQALYFHLGMYADDDGFVNPKKIIRMLGVGDDDLKVLATKRFVLCFDNGVIVIKHWRMNNLVRKDWYRATQYNEQFKTLTIKENGSYTDNPSPKMLVNDSLTVRSRRLGKVRIGKDTEEAIKLVNKPIDLELAELLVKKIISNTPTFKSPDIDSWASHIRLMRERDNRTEEQIRFVIDWCQKSTFWQANILSTGKLREKFDTLVAQIKRDASKDIIKKSSVAFT